MQIWIQVRGREVREELEWQIQAEKHFDLMMTFRSSSDKYLMCRSQRVEQMLNIRLRKHLHRDLYSNEKMNSIKESIRKETAFQ